MDRVMDPDPRLHVSCFDARTVDINQAIRVDINMTVMPVPMSPCRSPEGPHEKSRSKPDKTRGYDDSGTIRINDIGWICRPPPWSKNPPGIINGHIDDRRIVRRNADDIIFPRYQLLFGIGEIPCIISPLPKLLNGGHDVLFLDKKSVPHHLGPFHFFTHHCQNCRERNQGLHTHIPQLSVEGIVELVPLKILVLPDPAVGYYDFKRIS
jgi:hypothetical protein